MLSVVSEQPQGELGVLDVTVRQQQQVPGAARRRQEAEGPQGPPQLSAASYWRGVLRGGREETDESSHCEKRTADILTASQYGCSCCV